MIKRIRNAVSDQWYRWRIRRALRRRRELAGWFVVLVVLVVGCAHSRVDRIHTIEHRCLTEIAASTTADDAHAIEARCNDEINGVQHGQ